MRDAAVERVRLPDGRRLAFTDSGESGGLPLFYFHGVPSSRIEPLALGLPAVASRAGIRLIVPDRPGIGLSDPLAGRQLGDWPADILALANHLRIGQFAVVGCSGGGPYALACAERIPERLLVVAVISGTAPFDVPGLTEGIAPDNLRFLRLSIERPRLHALVAAALGLYARAAPRRFLSIAASALPPADIEAMADPLLGAAFARAVAEGARQALRGGATRDTALMVSPWAIDPSQIAMPVLLWHGEADVNAPVAMGHYLAEQIPEARATFLPGEGHFSMFVHHIETIVRAIKAAAIPR